MGCPLAVTTRITIFLVGNPNLNLHLPLASWEGGQPNIYVYIYMYIYIYNQISSHKDSKTRIVIRNVMLDVPIIRMLGPRDDQKLPKGNCFYTGSPWKLTWLWKIPIFNRKYIFIYGGFFIVMLVFRWVPTKHLRFVSWFCWKITIATTIHGPITLSFQLQFHPPKIWVCPVVSHPKIPPLPENRGTKEPCLQLFWGFGFPYITRIHTAYIGEDSSILGTWNVRWHQV